MDIFVMFMFGECDILKEISVGGIKKEVSPHGEK